MYFGTRASRVCEYWLLSVAYDSAAMATDRMSAIVRFCFERCMAVSILGMAIAARMPMTAMTNSPPTMTTMTITAGLVPADFAAGGGAPLVGRLHRGHGANETWSTGFPQ